MSSAAVVMVALVGVLVPRLAAEAGAPDAVAPTQRPSSLPVGDVAFGQPVTLPAGVPAPAFDGGADPATAVPAAAGTPLSGSPPAARPGAGTGWLGLTVDDAIVTGRLAVVAVAPDGPAAQAGIRPQDVLLALDGRPLNNDDELAAALAAIAPGQEVKAAVGRDNRIENLVITASPRPVDQRTRPRPATAEVDPFAPRTAQADPAPQQPASPLAAAATPSPPGPVPMGIGQVAAEPTSVVPLQPLAPPPVVTAQAPPPLATVPPRSVLVPPAGAAAAPAMADVPPSPFAQAPPMMVPAPRFGAGAEQRTVAPPLDAGQVPRRYAEPAALPPGPPPPAMAAVTVPEPLRHAAVATSGRPALGVRTVPVDVASQSRFRLSDPRGALVVGVVHDLPASRAGVPPGSVIVAINDRPVASPRDLSQLVSHGPVGIPVSLEYVLPGGEAKRAEVVLQPLEAPLERALVGPSAEPTTAGGAAAAVAEPALLQPTLARRMITATERGERIEDLLRRLEQRIDDLERRLETAGRPAR